MPNSLSEELTKQWDDLSELYAEEKQNGNAAAQERIIKLMSTLAKQIKEHRTHEQETLDRNQLKELAQVVGATLGKNIKRYIGDDAVAALVIEAVNDDLLEMVEKSK